MAKRAIICWIVFTHCLDPIRIQPFVNVKSKILHGKALVSDHSSWHRPEDTSRTFRIAPSIDNVYSWYSPPVNAVYVTSNSCKDFLVWLGYNPRVSHVVTPTTIAIWRPHITSHISPWAQPQISMPPLRLICRFIFWHGSLIAQSAPFKQVQ